jgi:hypothetical protein
LDIRQPLHIPRGKLDVQSLRDNVPLGFKQDGSPDHSVCLRGLACNLAEPSCVTRIIVSILTTDDVVDEFVTEALILLREKTC